MTVKVRKYKRGGWEVDIRFMWPDGSHYRERRRTPVSSISAARRWGEARERELLTKGKPVESPAEKEVPTLKEFVPKFMDGYARANKQKASTIDSKQSVFDHHLLPRLGDKRLDQIKTQDVQLLKAAYADFSPKTVNNIVSVLSKTLKVAVEWGVIDTMPCQTKLLKVEQDEAAFYEPEDYDRLVEAAGKVGHDALVLVLLAGDGGLRRGEIMALRWCDVDFRRRQISVARNIVRGVEGLPKGGKIKRVPMTELLAETLKEHRHLRSERVLCQEDGTPLTPKMIRRLMERIQRRAGLEPTGAVHILRHSFCSHLAMQGAPTMAIKELARHAHLSTTMRYMHLSPSSLEDAVKLLDGARKEAKAKAEQDAKAKAN